MIIKTKIGKDIEVGPVPSQKIGAVGRNVVEVVRRREVEAVKRKVEAKIEIDEGAGVRKGEIGKNGGMVKGVIDNSELDPIHQHQQHHPDLWYLISARDPQGGRRYQSTGISLQLDSNMLVRTSTNRCRLQVRSRQRYLHHQREPLPPPLQPQQLQPLLFH